MFGNASNRRRSPAVAAFLAAAVLSVGSVSYATMWIENESDAVNQRFYTGASPDFIGQAYNWSGVAQASNGTWVTMISPQYFLSANHYHAGPGSTVTFYAGNSTSDPSYTATVGSFYANNGDCYIGELTAPIPSSANITYYPLLNLPSWNDYVGLHALVYGNPNLVGATIIDDIGDGIGIAGTIEDDWAYYGSGPNNVPSECYLIGGDSGGPTFATLGGQLEVLGMHYYDEGAGYPPPDGYLSGDSFDPAYITWLDAEMTSNGGGQVTLYSVVPEPISMIFFVTGLAAVGGYISRRRMQRKA